MRQNYLLEPLQCLLEGAAGSLSEYELIQQLQTQGWLEPIKPGDTLSLYSCHFLVYNALYQLQDYYLKHGQKRVFISALAIEVIASVEGGDLERAVASSEIRATDNDDQARMAELRDYYLDWDNVENATKDTVEQLLGSFWEQFVSDIDYAEALAILHLPAGNQPIDYQAVKTAYRRLAMEHHPDRGGDTKQFQRINWAFGVLQRVF